jgi:hypothetical protein
MPLRRARPLRLLQTVLRLQLKLLAPSKQAARKSANNILQTAGQR